jgi:hypothetical protein
MPFTNIPSTTRKINECRGSAPVPTLISDVGDSTPLPIPIRRGNHGGIAPTKCKELLNIIAFLLSGIVESDRAFTK